jgi:glycosyltransferase involved in cell wall biosynthesis
MVGTRETGNETYCAGLVEGLAQLGDGNQYVVYVSQPDALASVASAPHVERRVLSRDSSAWRLTMGFARASRADNLDLLHVTYNVPFFTRCPTVVAVHDISYVQFPEFFSKRDLRLLSTYVPYSVRTARRVLTISESAAEDIERVYHVPREKITVVPLAARAPFTVPRSPEEVDAFRAELGLEGPYVLAVGNLQPRKNLRHLVEAFARLPRSFDNLKLALVGKAQWRESDIYECVEALGLKERVVFTGYVPDERLALLYRGALALVYPSLYEGFGLPILEAMACGAPVICSNTSSMPEVAGDAALMVDPLDVNAISAAMTKVVSDEALRGSLTERGYKRNAIFSWRETARITAQEYERCFEATARQRLSGVAG